MSFRGQNSGSTPSTGQNSIPINKNSNPRGSSLGSNRQNQMISPTVRFLIFLIFFGLTGAHFTNQFGLPFGIYLTVLTWTFFILCLPLTGKPVITSAILAIFSNRANNPRWYTNPHSVRWFAAALINIVTYIVAPYTYLTSVTTFLLYRIISNPWPYWMIIFASSLNEIYSAITTSPHSIFRQGIFRHATAKAVLMTIGFVTFFYLSYHELVVFIYSKTC